MEGGGSMIPVWKLNYSLYSRDFRAVLHVRSGRYETAVPGALSARYGNIVKCVVVLLIHMKPMISTLVPFGPGVLDDVACFVTGGDRRWTRMYMSSFHHVNRVFCVACRGQWDTR